MPAVSDDAKAKRRDAANARARERYANDALYRAARQARQQAQREARAAKYRERYATDETFRRAADQRRSARRSTLRRIINDERPFVGCDGEGVGRGADSRYALFRMGDRELGPFANDRAITTPQLLRFICEAPDGPIYVGFAFEYDISNIMRHVPHVRRGNKPSRLDRVMRRDAASLMGVKNSYFGNGRWTWLTFDGFETFGVNYLARNHLSVCRGQTRRGFTRMVKGSARTIYDVFGNFQSSFVKALENWDFAAKHRDTIERMKQQRSGFTTITQEIRDYCAKECVLLGELMTDFRKVCLDNELRPRTWNGAGKIAAALHDMMGTVKAKELDKLIPAPVRRMAHAGYYGGRFEVFRLGDVGDAYEHDIASAYPAKMLHLPCLRHGEWLRTSGADLAKLPADAIYVAPVKFAHPFKQHICGLPIRNKKTLSLSWPRNGNGTYWSCEIRSAIRLGAAVEHREGFRYVRRCDCKVFADVERLYNIRVKIGKGRRGIPIKLGINSLYGKLAQRIGNPVYANPVWAGLITAMTRAQINDAVRQNPRDVVMIATDGVYTVNRRLKGVTLYEPDKAPLGGWECKAMPGLFIVQPGLYWARPDEKMKVKSRGVSASVFSPYTDQFRARWQRWLRYQRKAWDRFGIVLHKPAIKISVPMFVGMRLAYHRGKPETSCQWIDTTKKISFDWTGKRGDMKQVGDAAVLGSLAGSALLQSFTYSEHGLAAADDTPQLWSRMELEAMPDGGTGFAAPEVG